MVSPASDGRNGVVNIHYFFFWGISLVVKFKRFLLPKYVFVRMALMGVCGGLEKLPQLLTESSNPSRLRASVDTTICLWWLDANFYKTTNGLCLFIRVQLGLGGHVIGTGLIAPCCCCYGNGRLENWHSHHCSSTRTRRMRWSSVVGCPGCSCS